MYRLYWKTITRCVRLGVVSIKLRGMNNHRYVSPGMKFRDISKRKNSLIKEIRLRASSVQVLSLFFPFIFKIFSI